MPARVHYIRSHFRESYARPPRQRARYYSAARFSAGFLLASIVSLFVFVAIGAWLIASVASIGRSHTDCLQSGRRVCGILRHGDLGKERVPLADRQGIRPAQVTTI
jgi:hypothetical protein